MGKKKHFTQTPGKLKDKIMFYSKLNCTYDFFLNYLIIPFDDKLCEMVMFSANKHFNTNIHFQLYRNIAFNRFKSLRQYFIVESTAVVFLTAGIFNI